MITGICMLSGIAAIGCVGGGGPVFGCPIGEGNCFVGAEVGGGFPLAQGTVGFQTGPTALYARLDAAFDIVGINNGDSPSRFPGGRLGVGVSTAEHAFTFDMGAHVGVLIRENGDGRSCNEPVPVALLGVDLRYLDTRWFVAFTPRIEWHQPICSH